MNEMIERAAAAAFLRYTKQTDGLDYKISPAEFFRNQPAATRALWLSAIEAAIEAMREPTKEMIEEGKDTIWNFASEYAPIDPDPDCKNQESAETIAAGTWRAMIDSALNS